MRCLLLFGNGGKLVECLNLEYHLTHMLKIFIIFDANLYSNCFPFALTDINEEGIWPGQAAINKLSKIRDRKHYNSFR